MVADDTAAAFRPAPTRHERAWRPTESGQAYLLALSDSLRPLADPIAIQGVAAELLGRHLRANQVHYAETVGDDTVEIRQGYGDGLSAMVGTFRHQSAGWGARLLATYRAGFTAVCHDIESDPTMTRAEAPVIAAAGLHAYIAAPLVKDKAWVATLAVHSIAPRTWTPDEVALVEETAGRSCGAR
jgi:GAF domain-containing protein